MDGKERYVKLCVEGDAESATVTVETRCINEDVLFAFSALVQRLIEREVIDVDYLRAAFEVGVDEAKEAKNDGGTNE